MDTGGRGECWITFFSNLFFLTFKECNSQLAFTTWSSTTTPVDGRLSWTRLASTCSLTTVHTGWASFCASTSWWRITSKRHETRFLRNQALALSVWLDNLQLLHLYLLVLSVSVVSTLVSVDVNMMTVLQIGTFSLLWLDGAWNIQWSAKRWWLSRMMSSLQHKKRAFTIYKLWDRHIVVFCFNQNINTWIS